MSIKTIEGGLNVTNARFCIVVARWNSFVVDSLEAGAIDTLKRHGGRHHGRASARRLRDAAGAGQGGGQG